MRVYTDYPHPNSLLAKRIISEMAPRLFDDLHHRWMFYGGINVGKDGLLRDKIIGLIIDEFMAEHPRGKGTAGNEDKRRFYAACHVIKGNASRTPYKRSYDERASNHIESFAKGLHDALMSFPEDGSSVMYPTQSSGTLAKPIDKKLFDKMVEWGFATGMYEARGVGFTSCEAWLTDKGMLMRDAVIRLRKRKKADEIKRGTTVQDRNGDWASTITIGGKVAVTVTLSTADESADLQSKIVDLMRREARR